MNKPEELKGCPFCGRPAKVSNSHEDDFRFIVFCLACWAQTDEKLTREDAIKAWNTRRG